MSIIAINAKQPEEIRVAVLDPKNNKSPVSDLYIENNLKKVSLKNIYAGVIKSIEPSLEAVFVDYGFENHGFLQFKDIANEYCKNGERHLLRSSLKVGQSIIVQVKKEERVLKSPLPIGQSTKSVKKSVKGAALTTYISLPGIYLVLRPNHPTSGGISRWMELDTRKEMKQITSQLDITDNMSVIVRTAGAGRSIEELKTDLALLMKQWEAIKKSFKAQKAPFLIFPEGDILVRTLRDYVREDLQEIVVDDPTVFEKLQNYAERIRPDILNKIRLYKDQMSLFLQLEIEDYLESAFQRTVRLPSGGSIVFDRGEALGAMIDVNSRSSTKHEDSHETALRTNLEAAEMVAKQLRLRDLGGLILIDFIGMKEPLYKKQVETKFSQSIQDDRARIHIGYMDQFDVLVLSRERLRSSLGEVHEDVCEVCQGQGTLRSVESLALSIVRTVEKKVFFEKPIQIRIEASVKLITYLSNEQRAVLYQLEQAHHFQLILLPNPYWEVTQYQMTSVSEEASLPSQTSPSYQLISDVPKEDLISQEDVKDAIPALQHFGTWDLSPVNESPNKNTPRFFKKIFDTINAWSRQWIGNTQPKPNTTERKRLNKLPHALESYRAPAAARPKIQASRNAKAFENAHTTVMPPKVMPANKHVVHEPTVDVTETKPLKKKQNSHINSAPVNKTHQTPAVATPTLQAKPSLDISQRKMVYRYGGEPRVQPRGYYRNGSE